MFRALPELRDSIAGRRGLLRPSGSLAACLVLTLAACSSTDTPVDVAVAGTSTVGGSANTAGSDNGGGAAGAASAGMAGTAPVPSAGNGGASIGTAGATSGGANAAGGGSTTVGGSAAGTAAGGTPPANERCDIANYDAAKPPQVLTLSGSLGTHDPVMIGADGRFYLFSTGNNLGAKTSANMLAWQNAPDVFSTATRPAWIAQAVPGVRNLWAPDISFFGGVYHLYYSASTFGSNHSCIGHATRASLGSGTWTDHGQVICSNAGTTKDDWNAIDPNVIVDEAGTPWLALGSFWSGIKLIKLDQTGARSGTSLDALASRPSAGGAVEGAFIVRRCGFYYLFTWWDACCKGADSTYNTRVGRSTAVAGPYVDKDGVALLKGGGTLLLKGGDRYRGPGHNAVVFTDTAAFNVYHSYDADNNGTSVLRIAELVWDKDGWPISGGP
ncbi:MAG: arabinan endo-1,5-alpha-L-arabinosidase [Myxococcales bacterium]